MTWFKVDDSFSDHPKVRRIPRKQRPSAIGLWTLAGSWSARHLTDGAIPEYMVEEFGCSAKDSAALVAAGLWDVAEDGWVFHDWTLWQPSKEKVEADREAAAERQRRARQRAVDARKARESHSDSATEPSPHHDEVTPPSRRDETVTHEPVTSPRPDPTRPDLLPTEEGQSPADTTAGAAASADEAQPEPKPRSPRATRIPANFVPAESTRREFLDSHPGVTAEALLEQHENFCDWWKAKSGRDATKVDWDATWRVWMRKNFPARAQVTAPGDALARRRAQHAEWRERWQVASIFDDDTEESVAARSPLRGVS